MTDAPAELVNLALLAIGALLGGAAVLTVAMITALLRAALWPGALGGKRHHAKRA